VHWPFIDVLGLNKLASLARGGYDGDVVLFLFSLREDALSPSPRHVAFLLHGGERTVRCGSVRFGDELRMASAIAWYDRSGGAGVSHGAAVRRE
jgi:hypothetical protein